MLTRGLIIFCVCVVATFFAGCARSHVAGWEIPAGGDDEERVCEIRATEPDRTLEPSPDNPRACPRPEACGFWFGHGAHFACRDHRALSCEGVWDCACDTSEYADEAFEADFSAGLATLRLDGGAVCRYRIWGPG